ncbi:PepSY domain-containing protein [uncultured Sphingomonas sp.]|uniref:PepSY domain-containing protein n=1 Tax=uncultured Sphingomonas sp. TaxID=158754 RepID=UPI00260B0760|nr:PepSY domain-containing protein [uncultured Sphingomonas sp.]
MKTIGLIAACIIATPALADQPGRGWIAQDRLSTVLAKQGYHLTKVEADDGHWEGEMTKNGVLYEFHADPRTGKLTSIKPKHRDRK